MSHSKRLEREFVQAPLRESQKFRRNFTSTPLQSILCKSNVEMYVFGIELSNELSVFLWRHVTCQGQRLLSSSWSPAMPAEYIPDVLDSFVRSQHYRRYSGTCKPFFVCLHYEDVPWLKLHPQPFSLHMRLELPNCSKCCTA